MLKQTAESIDTITAAGRTSRICTLCPYLEDNYGQSDKSNISALYVFTNLGKIVYTTLNIEFILNHKLVYTTKRIGQPELCRNGKE